MATKFVKPITETKQYDDILVASYLVDRVGHYLRATVILRTSDGETKTHLVEIVGEDFDVFYSTFDRDTKLYEAILAKQRWTATIDLTGEPQ